LISKREESKMANALFTSARVGFLEATLGNLTSVTVKIHLVDTADYTVNLATHDFENDITDAGIVSTATVTISSAAGGELDASNTTFSSVTGDVCEALVSYVDTAGADTTDPLIAYYDTFSAGMPVTPNGGDITVAWPSGIMMQINAN
jgi:hypothetical protein